MTDNVERNMFPVLFSDTSSMEPEKIDWDDILDEWVSYWLNYIGRTPPAQRSAHAASLKFWATKGGSDLYFDTVPNFGRIKRTHIRKVA